MTRARVLVALVCVLAALVVAQTLVARAKVAGLRDTIEVYQTKGTVSAATLSGATVRERIVFDLANTRCAGPAGCPPAKRVTVEPCDGGLCVSYDGSRRKKVDGCRTFSFTPTRAAFDPGAGRWFVTEFDARLETKGGGSCGTVKAVWEVSGRPV
ncbi:hypothetical protein [Herbidospora sp. NBRC 101105]|uniref:hypothetical protein n=1 Tax=Herbidospora sp. NBRC 101105 TaxID=3032195 RepID=UPI002554D0A7|nr:hypothetical protein [Herbidospora sp. NBRC 101105]